MATYKATKNTEVQVVGGIASVKKGELVDFGELEAPQGFVLSEVQSKSVTILAEPMMAVVFTPAPEVGEVQ